MISNFRNYNDTNEKIKLLYKEGREKQTLSYVKRKIYENRNRKKEKINIWEVVDKLSSFIDVSDPDVNIPNAHHLFQTAEEAKKEGMPEWFQLICLLHDMGKIMFLWGNDEDGTTIKNQWGIVGDTFIVGIKIPNSIVFSEFNDLNIDHKNNLNTYYNRCGLNMCYISWGHDEFMYHVLENNVNTIPEEGYYIIRYHSLYLWHFNNEYLYYENEKDKRMKKWVKTFNNFDLYTKVDLKTDIIELKKYYSKLVLKYFKTEKFYW